MRRALALILLLVAAAVIAAEPFTFTISPAEAAMKTNETTTFSLVIKHPNTEAESFELFSSDVLWDLRTTEPLIIPPDGMRTQMILKPLFSKPGVYGVPISVRRTKTGEIKTQTITIELRSPENAPKNYLPAIKGSSYIERGVNPSGPAEITVDVESQNNAIIPQLVIKARSSTINADHTTNLGPFEKKTLKFSVILDPLTPPQNDFLRTTIIAIDAEGKSFTYETPSVEFSITPYGTVKETEEKSKTFLKQQSAITLQNTGNIPRVMTYEKEIGIIRSLFTGSVPSSSSTGGTLSWDIALEIGQSKQIILVTSYWSAFLAVIFFVLAGISYFTFRSSIVLKKSARIVSTKEGGISELKILLSAYNRSRKTVKNVRIIDLVPRIAEYLKQTDAGSIEPDSIVTHEQKGSILKWKIHQLEPNEERIIVYRIKAKFAIIGGIRLPLASSRYEFAPGNDRTVNSSSPVISL